MQKEMLNQKAQEYLQFLCNQLPTRRVGSGGNQQATAYIADQFRSLGLRTDLQKFFCIDWENNGASLTINGSDFSIQTSPYSLACAVTAPLVCASTLAELEKADSKEKILLLQGELCVEQLMPKNFTFYNPEPHKQLIALLEKKQPAAILTATGRNPELAGGMYPFPLIEDGDFGIPNAYLKDVDGEKLANFTGSQAALTIRSRRIPSCGENVIGLAGDPAGKHIVISAHVDAKNDTPGALDNGSGVAILLLLAEILRDYHGPSLIELVVLNGEDHYSAQGEKEYLRSKNGKFEHILLNINIDAAGYKDGRSAYSFYNCPDSIRQAVHSSLPNDRDFLEGDAWYQSDHSIFLQVGVPAIAITSEKFMYLTSFVTHTAEDTVDMVDIDKVVETSCFIGKILHNLNPQPANITF
ncbi:MAG: M28 family peptidase [Pelolinea sp.]|jgi:aminopeptidase YwaD|nr:M28 family peptidase [Pelolinea sp.]